jgi:mannose-1-phosphate guanylyltransferase
MSNGSVFQALILAGGKGTRFWPLSRGRSPKQVLALESAESLLRKTVARLSPLIPPSAVWVCTTRDLTEIVRQEIPEVPREQILSEPMGRDTAAAIGWSIHRMKRQGEDPIVAVLPADHRIGDDAPFRDTLEAAAREVQREDRVMTLGVKPRWAETGYGYLELGDVLDPKSGVRRVARFTEKPSPETAERFVASGDYLWNAGIFVFRGERLLQLLEEHEPAIARGLRSIDHEPEQIDEFYAALPKISIDYAVMERCPDLATLPLDCGWSDLGSWAALAEVLERDGEGNSRRGDVVSLDSKDNLLFAAGGAVAVVGISGLVVVQTEDAVLVIPRERSQEVKDLVEELRRRGRNDLL